jgi:hypothetical protein
MRIFVMVCLWILLTPGLVPLNGRTGETVIQELQKNINESNGPADPADARVTSDELRLRDASVFSNTEIDVKSTDDIYAGILSSEYLRLRGLENGQAKYSGPIIEMPMTIVVFRDPDAPEGQDRYSLDFDLKYDDDPYCLPMKFPRQGEGRRADELNFIEGRTREPNWNMRQISCHIKRISETFHQCGIHFPEIKLIVADAPLEGGYADYDSEENNPIGTIGAITESFPSKSGPTVFLMRHNISGFSATSFPPKQPSLFESFAGTAFISEAIFDAAYLSRRADVDYYDVIAHETGHILHYENEEEYKGFVQTREGFDRPKLNLMSHQQDSSGIFRKNENIEGYQCLQMRAGALRMRADDQIRLNND